jgi:hypothetical protein
VTLSPAYQDDAVSVFHCGHDVLAAHLAATGVVADAMIVDAPYSERTHAGHNGAVEPVNGALPPDRAVTVRRGLGYAHFAAVDVAAFVAAWSPLVRGWMVSLTDDALLVPWRSEMEAAGRLGFQSLPCCVSGMTVRLTGDGPSSEAVHAAVSRTRNAEMVRWGTLPGFYSGPAERCPWVGGKPVWLIRALVRDYSRAGDLIVDPCCGAGTLGVAVRYEGRKAILADRDEAAVLTTIKRLRGERTKPTNTSLPADAPHALSLFREVG